MIPSSVPPACDASTRFRALRAWLREVPDDVLLGCYVTRREQDPTLTAFLPRLPSVEIQSQFTGLSNLEAFRQGIAFLRTLRDFSNEMGMTFGAPYQRVLDFGCGWGRITQLLLPFFGDESIDGVDVMPAALDHCRASGSRVNLHSVFPWPPTQFASGSVDVITAYSVFSHLSEDNSFAWIREFHRVLKPGGIVAVTTRYRDFFPYLESLRSQTDRPDFARGAAKSFVDTGAALAAYDRGEFCFDSEGRGGPGLTATYGEAAIPQSYAERVYSEFFREVRFVLPNYSQHLDQAVILLRK